MYGSLMVSELDSESSVLVLNPSFSECVVCLDKRVSFN